MTVWQLLGQQPSLPLLSFAQMFAKSFCACCQIPFVYLHWWSVGLLCQVDLACLSAHPQLHLHAAHQEQECLHFCIFCNC